MERRPQPVARLPGRVRIIGGQWRGRWLTVPLDAEVRPSADRVRETLFNWLQPYLDSANCLDLFAGTGALGIEAVSRGARAATLVDHSLAVIGALTENLKRLEADHIEVVRYDALEWLKQPPVARFDVVFLDPPYATDLLSELFGLLGNGWLAPTALIYVETGRLLTAAELPQRWQIRRQGQTRHVCYTLLQYAAA